MITTNKYILGEDIFEPSTYRNLKFSKICQRVKNRLVDPHLSRFMHLNVNGQIDRIERINPSWNSYPPGKKPQLRKINVIDYLEYNEKNKIKSIITRPKENYNLQIGRIEYKYLDDQLFQIKTTNTKTDSGNNKLTILKYDKENISRVESKIEIDGVMKTFDTIDYQWNENDQIISKEHTSLIDPEKLLTVSSIDYYTYKMINQLDLAIKKCKIDSEIIESTTKFKYVNPTSNILSEVDQFEFAKLSSSMRFSIDKYNNTITQKFSNQHNESLIEFIYYT